MGMKKHPFHLVSNSPWPIISSLQLFNTMLITAFFFNSKKTFFFQNFTFNVIIMVSIMGLWWRDIIRESTFENEHTKEVLEGLKIGMIMFITSEIFFFISFFWAYFHSSLSPDSMIGESWPPIGIQSFNPASIPLLNTIILLSSGVSLTASHHFLMNGKKKKSLLYLMMTILLGMYFSFLQWIEYKEASFSMSDSIYGSIFFMSTGFHGIHVLVGTTFLMICFLRLMKNHFSAHHHFGFEAAAWYWHFVDVVWLFLYIFVYWWSS